MLLFILLLLPAVHSFVTGEILQSEENVCKTRACINAANRLSGAMNKNVDPCDNFYAYACGNFGKYMRRISHQDQNFPSSWVINSQMNLERKITEILASNITDSEPEALKKAKKFYRSCIDTDSMNSKGIVPLRKVLRQLGISSSLYFTGKGRSFDWISTAVKYKKYFNKDFLFYVNVRPEYGNPNSNYISIEKPIEEDKHFPKIISKKNRLKQNFMKERSVLPDEKISAVIEVSSFIENIARIIDVGTAIENLTDYAEHLQWKAALLIHLQKQNIEVMEENGSSGLFSKMMTLRELQNFTDAVPSLLKGKTHQNSLWKFDWERYFRLLLEDVGNIDLENEKIFDKIMVYDDKYLKEIIAFMKEYSAYFESLLWFKAVQLLIFYTTDDLRKLAFDFIKEPSMPMKTMCRDLTLESMDMAVAYPLVDENAIYYKNEVTEMTDNLKHVLGQIVETSSWLDDETKNATYAKIKKMRSFVSHPFWLSNASAVDKYYEKFNVVENDFLQTVMNINDAIVKMNLETLQRPVYEHEICGSNILEMNAFYYPRDNAMCIPRGIIQFPFYGHPIQAINYGTLGSIVGHEITHGFDHESKIFSAEKLHQTDKNLLLEEYRQRKLCFVDSYNSIEVGMGGFPVNGARTLKENIADHGGLEEAFRAYQLYIQKNGQEQSLPGFQDFTNEQLFTLAFSNLWCEETSLISLVAQLLTDEHSPNEARVVGPLRNFKQFSQIWNCPIGSKMNPPKKCRLF